MNSEMRKFLTAANADEDSIFNRLRRAKFEQKLREWPSEILSVEFQFNNELWTFYDEYKAIRDEITHPKNHDHSIYAALDAANPTVIRCAIAHALVQFFEARHKPWPYWLTGWNYVGLNANPSWPLESNNLNGFYHSMRYFGFSNLGDGLDFDQRCMVTRKNFDDLCEALERLDVDIEPFLPTFPQRPRLTRRWWDHDYLVEEYHRNISPS